MRRKERETNYWRIAIYVALCATLIAVIGSISCGGGGGGDDGIVTPGRLALYVGSSACAPCHAEIYEIFSFSGHPFKLNQVQNGQPPGYPYTEVPEPPAGYTWDDITYVIGGFGWKARFIGADGYIITGDENATTQYNLATRGWVAYHAGEQKPYDCGSCHTTGYTPEGNQDGLPGLIGQWAEAGVGCEACHGPGSNHVDNPSGTNINRTAEVAIDPGNTCANCHIRSDITVIDAKGGFIKHHEQSEELLQSPHNGVLTCTSCHDPHASVIHRDSGHNPEGGLVAQCADCHELQSAFEGSSTMKAAGVTCEDCHMPPLAKSATGDLATFTGDISTHLFRINTDPAAPQFSADGSAAMPYITLPYACQHCHIEGGSASAIPLESLATRAAGYHTPAGTGTYAGSAICASCHSDIYEKFQYTGHPYKLNPVSGGPPTYPYSEVPNPPAGYSWADVTYVIGGYGWKARFIGVDGYIITGGAGDTTQYNLADQGWVAYHAGEQKPYDCGTCHTTGYSSEGNQDGLPGLIGTWEEPGVQCEACHGPAGAHVNSPSPLTINMDMDPNDACALCHIRGDINVIDAKGGFTKHHEQYEEMLQSPHNSVLQCSSCHDPHASAVYEDPVINPNKGIVQTCDTCHPFEAANQKSANMAAALTCMDCHMAPMVKSAIGNLDTFTGDIASHLWKINTDPSAAQFTPDGSATNPYINVQYACQRCHIDGGTATPMGVDALGSFANGYHTGEVEECGDGYVGSETCNMCHPDKYETFILSGHPYKLNPVSGSAPTYPYSEVPNPPFGYTWADVTYVIGGYGWKARFIGVDGYIITGNPGDTTQYNLADQGWVAYHAGEQKPYDCGTCHTTGYMTEGNQDGLPGIVGTWCEPGIGCEACHGPGVQHVANPSPSTINLNMDPNDACALCHIRGDINVIDAKGGFTKHHEQYEEFIQSPHNAALQCSSCHDPHKSAVYYDPTYNPDTGIVQTCDTCHPDEATFQKSAEMQAGLTCMDCHMAPMVKSAIGNIDTFTGDVASHLWRINTDPAAEQFTPDGTETNPYITIPYACQRCHIAGGTATPIELGGLASYATGYHEPLGPDDYVGSSSCESCHNAIYETFSLTGHPYKLNPVSGAAPVYPYSSVPDPPAGYSWADVTYVIGGFGWKARFIGVDGYIITGNPGDTTQYNLATGGWVAYHAGEQKPYDCGRCHTTGYSSTGNQDGLPGLIGTWEEPGVTCEACHGPAGAHIMNPGPSTINIGLDPNDQCALCHIRGDINVIDASGGFTKHHEQSEELLQSPHNGILECTNCHDPHKSAVYADAVYNPDQGLVMACENCHANEAANQKSADMVFAGLTCIDCHMAPMVKSAIGDLSIFTGDISSHLFAINTDPDALQFTPDGLETNPYITIPYACQRCHITGGGASVMSLEGLAAFAEDYHGTPTVGSYAGSGQCQACHQVTYDKYMLSGHPYKLNPVSGESPTYPYSSVPNPPAGYSWSDVTYVIGGYGWKARFIGTDGYIITGNAGDTTQYNLETMGWVAYHAGELKPYDCGTCHTTGYSPIGNQDGLPGLIGTWEEPGVRCEACHGPGEEHVYSPSSGTINLTMDPEDSCALCHIRGDVNVIDASGGFIKHHEQYEEFLQSPHNGMLECTTCHDPHASVLYPDPVYNPDQGIIMTCETCHPDEAASYNGTIMDTFGLGCTGCHMTKLVKSAIGDLSIFTADISTHLFEINTSATAEQFNPAGDESYGYITLSYACLNCHYSGGPGIPLTLAQCETAASGFHD